MPVGGKPAASWPPGMWLAPPGSTVGVPALQQPSLLAADAQPAIVYYQRGCYPQTGLLTEGCLLPFGLVGAESAQL